MPGRADVPSLSYGERALVRWLEDRLGFVGAEAFVRRRGRVLVMKGLHDGVVLWRAEARNEAGVLLERGRYEVNPDVRKPAAFLRWLVDGMVRERK